MSKIQLTVFVIVFLAINNIFAQPGDIYFEYRLRSFNEVQDSIDQNPSNPFYRWARIQILFNPTFDLYTKSTDKLEDYALKYIDLYRQCDQNSVTSMRRQPCDMCPNTPVRILNPAKEMWAFLFENQKQLLKDLDKLVESGVEIKAPWNWGNHYSANKSSFLYKRGQFYYVTGKREKALKDYLEALELNPTIEQKRKISISIAAYYYTSDQVVQDKEKLVLKYINLSGMGGTKYEEERIDLLFSMTDSVFVINYFQELATKSLRSYLNLLNERNSSEPQTNIEIQTFYTFQKYEMLILEYLKKTQLNVSIDDLKNQMIDIIEKL